MNQPEQHPNAYFNQILERYVFKMANQYIESARPSTQNKLVQLVSKVTDLSDDRTPQTGLPQSECFEWEQVLSQPVDSRSVHHQWLGGVLRQRLERYKKLIVYLEQAVNSTSYRLHQLRGSQLQEPHRSCLEAYYTHLLDSYRQQLDHALSTSAFQLPEIHP